MCYHGSSKALYGDLKNFLRLIHYGFTILGSPWWSRSPPPTPTSRPRPAWASSAWATPSTTWPTMRCSGRRLGRARMRSRDSWRMSNTRKCSRQQKRNTSFDYASVNYTRLSNTWSYLWSDLKVRKNSMLCLEKSPVKKIVKTWDPLIYVFFIQERRIWFIRLSPRSLLRVDPRFRPPGLCDQRHHRLLRRGQQEDHQGLGQL